MATHTRQFRKGHTTSTTSCFSCWFHLLPTREQTPSLFIWITLQQSLSWTEWEVPIHLYSQDWLWRFGIGALKGTWLSMRTPSWNRKCRSRLEVMDTGQTPVTESLIKMCSCSWKASWIPFNQHVCFQDECPTSTILQLETRPSSCNSKCSLNLLEGSSPVHIPTICPHSSLSEQAPGGGDSNLDYPSVAQSDLVPTVT